MIKVCAFVDPAGTSISTQEDEYEEIRDKIEQYLNQSVLFKIDIPPWKIKEEPCDCYIIDYGGLAPMGARDTVVSIFRSRVEIVIEKPDTLFIIWSSFCERYYNEVIEDDYPGLVAPNI